MPGKCIFISLFLFVSFFHFSECVECYVAKAAKFCNFNPGDVDSPDLSKCGKANCKHGCGRSWTITLVSGPKDPKRERRGAMDMGKNIINSGTSLLQSISLGCVNDKAKDVQCKKLKDADKAKGLCVCDKKLCNSASNIVPATIMLSLSWMFALIWWNERLMRNPGSYKKDGTYLLWKVHERSNVNMYIYSYVVLWGRITCTSVWSRNAHCNLSWSCEYHFSAWKKKTICEMESLYYHFIIRAPTYGLDDLLCTFNFLRVLVISPFRWKRSFFLCRNMIFVAPCWKPAQNYCTCT